MPDNALTLVLADREARVNITWDNQNAELPSPVPRDATTEQVRAWVTESVQAGFPGMRADPRADFSDFTIKLYEPTEVRPYPVWMVFPQTPFGEAA